MGDTGARESKIFKLASNIIDSNIKVRFKSLINRDSKKDACTLRDPRLGLTLLQIAAIADNVPAGASLDQSQCFRRILHSEPRAWLFQGAEITLRSGAPPAEKI